MFQNSSTYKRTPIHSFTRLLTIARDPAHSLYLRPLRRPSSEHEAKSNERREKEARIKRENQVKQTKDDDDDDEKVIAKRDSGLVFSDGIGKSDSFGTMPLYP